MVMAVGSATEYSRCTQWELEPMSMTLVMRSKPARLA
jgi:hypothetical protein